jgi:thiol-disulfide isomerase/thioredoxin
MSRLAFRLWIAAAAAGIAILLLILGLAYGPQFLPQRTALRGPESGAVSEGSSTPAKGLELTLFDPPHAVAEIRFADDQGHNMTLDNFRGRAVLLNVWATWCVPCRKEMPALDRLQAKLGGNEFLVIPLSIDRDGAAAVKRFYQEVGVEKLGIYVDPSGRASRALSVPGVPTTLLIDREGREVARKMGEAQWDGPEMVALIERAMRGRSTNKENRDR